MSTVKHGDKYPIVLTVNMDLTGCEVRLLHRPRYSTAPGTPLAATITDATAGTVSHTLTGDLATGTYDLELEVTRDGQTVTFPTHQGDGEQYLQLRVVDDIA